MSDYLANFCLGVLTASVTLTLLMLGIAKVTSRDRAKTGRSRGRRRQARRID